MAEERLQRFMDLALAAARLAATKSEVPIGAVVVLHDEVIGRGSNQRESSGDASAHAEILAIREACARVGNWRLTEAEMFVTLEPCLMCFGAAFQSRIANIYYGCKNPKNPEYLRDIYENWPNGPKVVGGIAAAESQAMLSGFFEDLRKERGESGHP